MPGWAGAGDAGSAVAVPLTASVAIVISAALAAATVR
jgi:hypothetical protein